MKLLASPNGLFFHLFSARNCTAGKLGNGRGTWQSGASDLTFGLRSSCPWLLDSSKEDAFLTAMGQRRRKRLRFSSFYFHLKSAFSALIKGNNLFDSRFIREVSDIRCISFYPNPPNTSLQISNNLTTFGMGLASLSISHTKVKPLIWATHLYSFYCHCRKKWTSRAWCIPSWILQTSFFQSVYYRRTQMSITLLNCLFSRPDCHPVLSSARFFREMDENHVYMGHDSHRLGRLSLWHS